jgi:transcriptional regulator with XRE-family HTH domain
MTKRAIKHFRKQKGMKQKDLATAINASVDTIRRYESGLREPRASDIKKLAAVLGVSEAELLNGPAEEGYQVVLKYVKTLEGVNDEMMITGMELTVSDDGYVGVAGRSKFEGREDIDKAIVKIRAFLEEGFDSRERMRKKLEG